MTPSRPMSPGEHDQGDRSNDSNRATTAGTPPEPAAGGRESQERVRAFYDAGVDYERNRSARHRTEFAVTWRAITDALAAYRPAGGPAAGGGATAATTPAGGPAAPLRIIDIGAGPGYYSLALHKAGHVVTMLDLSPANVEYARKATSGALAGYHCGSATDLGAFPDGSFDAALLMGPLYHLLDEADRRRAVAEARRVLTRDGLLFAAFITAYAPLRDMAKFYPEEIAGYFSTPAAVIEWVKDGRWPSRPGGGFTDAYFAHPAVVRPFMEEAGFETLSLLACEGVVSMIEDKVNELAGPLWDYWVEVNYRLASDPSILGGCEHLLYIGKKKG